MRGHIKTIKTGLKTAQNFYIRLVAYKNTIKTAAIFYIYAFVVNKKMGILDAKGKANLLQQKQFVT